MKKFIICLATVICFAAGNQAIAQQKASYAGMFNVGALYGSNKTKFQLQTIHGVKYRGWFTGIGGGIDDYFQQSIPVFIDVRKDFFNKPNIPFLYIDGGINIVNKGTEENSLKTEMKPGIFYEGGIGYKLELSSKLAINLGAGYSFKSYEQNTYNKAYIPTPPYQTGE